MDQGDTEATREGETGPNLDQVDQVDIEATSEGVTSNGPRMVINKSLEDENVAEGEGRGGADKGDSEVEGAAHRAKIDYLLAEPRPAEAP